MAATTTTTEPTKEQTDGGLFFESIDATMMTIENGIGHCGSGNEWCTERLFTNLVVEPNAQYSAQLQNALTTLQTAWSSALSNMGLPNGYTLCVHLSSTGPRLIVGMPAMTK